ncbi:two pore domain potassium channel family protein, partial [Rhizobiaceae sp. 2RAB30]
MVDLSNPTPFLEIAIGTLGVILIIFVHGAGIRSISRRFNKSWVRVGRKGFVRPNLLLAITIGSLAGLHFLETLIWALPIFQGSLILSMRDSYY